jgi:hypothetical protein
MRSNDDTTPFIDLLFNLLLGYAFLFLVSFLLIQPIVKKAEVHTQAEYIITVTWPLDNTDDVDVWLEDPIENVVWFRNKEAGLAHLDRDDLGSLNDVVCLADGSCVKYPYNQELLTIRGFIGGEWVLNLHMYAKRTTDPTIVHVTVDKLNPTFQTILAKDISMSERGDEVTVSRFTMASTGDILSLDDLPKSIVQAVSVPVHLLDPTRGAQ